MRLIVGLGNPGSQYDKTRHNVGFWTLKRIGDKSNTNINMHRFNALMGETRIGQEKAILALPQTYMNLSGQSVAQLINYYKFAPSEVIVIHDDLDLPVGGLRIRQGGSHGGHNGIRSIIDVANMTDFIRIKIGIGRPINSKMDVKDYVLSQCSHDDMRILEEQCDRARDAVFTLVNDGLDKAMNIYNRVPKPSRAASENL